jgi:hypothetical protein
MVKFLKNHSSYNPGEVAGFSHSHEEWLVGAGVAVKVEDKQHTPQEAEMPGEKSKDPGAPQTRQTTVGPQKRK